MKSESPQDQSQESLEGENAPVRRIARNSAITVIASALQTVLMVLVLAVLARTLDKSDLGIYFAVFALAVALQLLLEAGLASIITLRIGQGPEQWQRIAAEATGILAIVVVISTILPSVGLLAWSSLSGNSLSVLVACAAGISCAGMQVQQFSFGLIRAFERFEFEGLSKITQSLSLLLLVSGFAVSGNLNLQIAVCCMAASYVVGGLFAAVVVSAKWPTKLAFPTLAILKNWLSESIPLGLGITLRRFTLQIDNLLLAALQPPAMLALYNVALRPLGPLNLLPQALVSASFPLLARKASTDKQSHQRALTAILRYLILVAIPVVATMWLFAEPIVVLLAGEKYLEAAMPLRVLSTILVFSFPTALFRFAFTSLNQQTVYAKLVGITLAIQIVLETVLIKQIGYMGACYGFLIGEAIYFAMATYECRRRGYVGDWWSGVIRATPACAALLLSFWAVQSSHLALQMPVAFVCFAGYLGLCVLCGAISSEELSTLWQAVKSRRQRKNQKQMQPLAKEKESNSVATVCTPSGTVS